MRKRCILNGVSAASQKRTFLRHRLSDAIRRSKFYGSDLPEELRAVLVDTSIAQ